MTTYPYEPGFKKRETSRLAGEKVSKQAPTLRAEALRIFAEGNELTADEVAKRMNRSILSVRPRIAELANMGEIVDAGTRRKNSSGHSAIVWRHAAATEAAA